MCPEADPSPDLWKQVSDAVWGQARLPPHPGREERSGPHKPTTQRGKPAPRSPQTPKERKHGVGGRNPGPLLHPGLHTWLTARGQDTRRVAARSTTEMAGVPRGDPCGRPGSGEPQALRARTVVPGDEEQTSLCQTKVVCPDAT